MWHSVLERLRDHRKIAERKTQKFKNAMAVIKKAI